MVTEFNPSITKLLAFQPKIPNQHFAKQFTGKASITLSELKTLAADRNNWRQVVTNKRDTAPPLIASPPNTATDFQVQICFLLVIPILYESLYRQFLNTSTFSSAPRSVIGWIGGGSTVI